MPSQQQLKQTAQAPVAAGAYGLATTDEQKRVQAAQGQASLGAAAAYGQQQDVYGQLERVAQGQAGPSQAQLQMAQQGQQNVVNQMGMAASARGGGLAAQQRQTQGIGAAAAMGTQQQMGQMQQQEQQQALMMQQQQANAMGQQAQQNAQFAEGTAQNVNQFMSGQDLATQQFNQQAAAQRFDANRQQGMDIAKMGLQAASSAAMLSDPKQKEVDDYEAGDEAIEALRKLRSTRYEYKPRAGQQKGEILGILTSDLERTKAGRQILVDTPKGKGVSLAGAVSLALSGVAELARKSQPRGLGAAAMGGK